MPGPVQKISAPGALDRESKKGVSVSIELGYRQA